MIVFIYDADGSPIGMSYSNSTYTYGSGDNYLFVKNIHGDIIAVYNESGSKVVSYTYDAWGNVTTTYHNGGGSTAARYNPFKYRGYYHDSELGFYYLNSRYYDPAIGRFINQDSSLYHRVLGYNMFAYCNNDPINYVDYMGESSTVAIWSSVVSFGKVASIADGLLPIGDIILIVGIIGLSNELNDELERVDTAKTGVVNAPKNITKEEVPDTDGLEDKGEKDNDKSKDHSLPIEGEPNSDLDLYDEDGIKQTRHYGPDGKADYDIDYRHGGSGHKFPHKHIWDWNKPSPRGGSIDIF